MPRYNSGRDTTTGARKLSIFWLRKNNYLNSNNDKCHYYGGISWSSNGEPRGNIRFEIETDEDKGPYIQFIYKVKKHYEPEEAYRDINFKFDLVSQPCRYGGKRWYFKCGLYKNNIYCGRRVAILYSTGDYYGCRRCANLSYDSCNKNKKYERGIFGMLFGSWDSDEYLSKLKRRYYKGKPTRKYQKYLKMTSYSEQELEANEIELRKLMATIRK